MHFSSFSEFWAMGTHGPYVWASYSLMLLVVLWNIASAKRQYTRVKDQLKKRIGSQQVYTRSSQSAVE